MQGIEQLEQERSPAGGRKIVSIWPRVLAVAAMFVLVAGTVVLMESNGWFKRNARSRRPVALRTGDPEPGKLGVAKQEEKSEKGEPGVRAGFKQGVAVGEEREGDASKEPGTGAGLDRSLEKGDGETAVAKAAGPRAARRARKNRSGATSKAPGRKMAETEEQKLPAEPRKKQAAQLALDEVLEQRHEQQGAEETADETSGEPRSSVSSAAREETAQQVDLRISEDVDKTQQERRPDQILTFATERPAETALRAMNVAARHGVRNLTLYQSPRPVGQDMELELEIPLERYEQLLLGLADIEPPRQQRLSNAMWRSGNAYFRRLEDTYEWRRKVAMKKDEGAEKRAMKKGKGGYRAATREEPGGAPAAEDQKEKLAAVAQAPGAEEEQKAVPLKRQERTREEEVPPRVNLVIRLVSADGPESPAEASEPGDQPEANSAPRR